MSVRREGDLVRLEGDCHVEDAELLLRLLQDGGPPRADLSACDHAHSAVLQVLLACRTPIVAAPADPFLRDALARTLEVATGLEDRS